MTRAELNESPCRCVRCGWCHGTGRIRVDVDDQPDFDLDTCEGCGGDGLAEVCDRCRDLEDFDDDSR